MIDREASEKLMSLSKSFAVIAIVGPRQSGKTTLAKHHFKNHNYVTLEDLDNRAFAKDDPRDFLDSYNKGSGIIIDEAQYVPELFSYIQTRVDNNQIPGQFILTGSQNFLLNEKITQSLAGRVAFLNLLPLSIQELIACGKLYSDINQQIVKGFYPKLYASSIDEYDLYSQYLRTYIERDIRSLKAIVDLSTFQNFLRLLAGRIGQELNITSLGNDCGVSPNTIKSWLSILEASYIIFRLKPYYKNYNKRVIKNPKIYFYDTGIACLLLGIKDSDMLSTHYMKGNLFENLVVADIFKCFQNKAEDPPCYFWRDKSKREIDLLIETGNSIAAIEIKSGKTIKQEFFKGLEYIVEVITDRPVDKYLIYAGAEEQQRRGIKVMPWRLMEIA